MWTIRVAVAGDAAGACAVIRASILELCGADHGGEAAVLAPWLANKTPERVGVWIADNPGGVFVAEVGAEEMGAGSEELGRIAGVGVVMPDGGIAVNYVAPWARFRGVSRGLMAAMEARAAALGHAECRLVSTATARRFYLSLGYEAAGAPVATFGGKLAYPMRRGVGVA